MNYTRTSPVTNPSFSDQSPFVEKAEAYGLSRYLNESTIVDPDSGQIAEVTNRCIRKFLENCQSKLSSLELGQDLGEYKETLHSIHRPLGSMQDKLVHYLSLLTKAKRKLKNPISLRKALTDSYLEFRFGINPLVDDVAHIIASAGHYRFPVYPVEAGSSVMYGGVNDQIAHQNNNGYFGQFQPYYIRKGYTKYNIRYKGAIRTGASSGKISALQDYRLLPVDWAPTAWDLIPYSWMVDYFVNIGDIISALSFPTSQLAWGCRTIRTEKVVEYSDIQFAVPIPSSLLSPAGPGFGASKLEQSCGGGRSKFFFRKVSRSALIGADLIPEVRFNVPTGKFPYLNILAVTSQRFKSLVPFYK